jgi:hypothetical protein
MHTLSESTLNEIGMSIINSISQTEKVVGLSLKVRFNEFISNSHSAPKGYETNFGGRRIDKNGDPVPSFYPGWSGRAWIRFAKHPDFFKVSSMCSGAGLHMGTGGGGAYSGPWEKISNAHYQNFGHTETANYPHCYGYDAKIFLNDLLSYPEISTLEAAKEAAFEEHQKMLVWNTLKGSSTPLFLFKIPDLDFLWEDTDTKKADEQFISQYCL